YVEVIEVPSGARNVRVDEKGEAINYLAVQGEKGEFYLNGRWFIQWSGEYRAAGTTLYYQRDGEKESLHIPGPTKEPLRILLLYQTENPGLVYEYTIPNENATRKPEFHWSYADWTVCSASCGGGLQLSKPKCIEKEAGLVEDKYCDAATKPVEKTKECNKHQCPAKWWAGPWQHCSASCGQRGIRKRTVICVRSLNRDQQIALLDDDCETKLRPPDSEPCPHKRPCHGERETWSASQWSDVRLYFLSVRTYLL
ncbi:a disintegrin and metalloproteinase with thrombospondin motifs 7, partial [Nephila pilipes]